MPGLIRISTGFDFNQTNYNANQDSHERAGLRAIGRAVLEGLELSDDGGLDLGITEGVIHARTAYAIDAQVVEAPDNQTSMVWMDEEGAVTFSASVADPGGYTVCLGRVIASGGNITSVDSYGRMAGWRQSAFRTYELGDSVMAVDLLNGWVGVNKTPTTELDVAGTTTVEDLAVDADAVVAGKVKTSARLEIVEVGSDPSPVSGSLLLYVKDTAGEPELFYQDENGNIVQVTSAGTLQAGKLIGHVRWPTNTETISATKTLVATDKNVQALTASGGNQKVLLPNDPVDFGDFFKIMNVGSSNNVIVKNSTDTTTIATLTPGQYIVAEPVTDAGVAEWPSSITPVTMGGAL